MGCWALAITAPNCEMKTSARLGAIGVQHHLFKCRDQVIRRGRQVLRIIPAWSRYIFVNVMDGAWHQIERVKGVMGFVKFGNEYALISEQIVKHWKSQADENDCLREFDNLLGTRFRFGDKITINDTSVAYGMEGIYQYLLRPGRACVLIPWLGQMVPAEVDEDCIDKLANAPAMKARRRGGRSARHKFKRMRRVKRQRHPLKLSA